MKHSAEIRFVKQWKEEEIVDLYREGGWWKESYDPREIGSLIKGSFLFAVLLDGNGKAIGMGRAISDGASDAYIQDVVVRSSCRGMGFGKLLVTALVDELKRRKIFWIGLIAEEGTSDFYREMGFKSFSGEPMVLEVGT